MLIDFVMFLQKQLHTHWMHLANPKLQTNKTAILSSHHIKTKSVFKHRLCALAFSFAALVGTTAQAESLTVLLDWYVNPDHAQLIVADEGGFFKAHDLEVKMIPPSDPSAPPKLVAAGQADIAVTYQPELHVLVDKGLPVTRIGTLIATPLNSLIVLEDSPVQSVSDLEGRKIGYSGIEDVLLIAMLEKVGLERDDVELINVNFSLTPSLMSGNVDAVIGAYRNFELHQIAIAGGKGRAFYPEEHGAPTYDELIVIARNSALNQNKTDQDKLKRFMKALQDATTFMINHPEDSWKLFIASDPERNNELNRRAWADTLTRFALRPSALDTARYRDFALFLKDKGLVSQTPDVSSYALNILE